MNPNPNQPRPNASSPIPRLKSAALAAAFFVLAAAGVRAEVTVSNVAAAQVPGTKTVEITYDVASTETATVTVSLEITDDGAPVDCPSVSDDVGAGVATGTGKTIVWDGGADWNGNAAELTYTVTADDGVGGGEMPDGGDPTAASWEEVNDRWVKNTYADGAVTMSDRETGLIWVYDADANGTEYWNGAKSKCNNLTYAGHDDWFLPDIDQLAAMYSQKGHFKDVRSSWYWSSTPYSSYAYYVRMGYGDVFSGYRLNDYWVWPCRGGQ